MISNFVDTMTCMLQFYHYSLIFTSYYIGIEFIPAAELRGIQINKDGTNFVSKERMEESIKLVQQIEV